MLALNDTLFVLLNAPAEPPDWHVLVATAVTDSPVLVAPLLLAVLWVYGNPGKRAGLVAAGLAPFAGQGVNMALGLLWFDPRPFTIPVGHLFVYHAADNGFPSDHATLVWTLGASLLLTRASPRWGAVVCVYGVLVAWSRVWLGVHFPLDVLTSAGVGVGVGAGAQVATPMLGRLVLPGLERAYERTLTLIRVPPGLAPRHPARH